MNKAFLSTAIIALASGPVAAASLDHLPLLTEVAPGAEQISPHIPQMGEHWAETGNLPTGPIYCVIEGRVVCVEYMFTAEDLAAGESWRGLVPGISSPPITHIEMEYMPEGVGPMQEPLYQLHIYFAEPELLAQY